MTGFRDENNCGFRAASGAGRATWRERLLQATPSGVEIVLFGGGMIIINRLRPIRKRVEIDALKSLIRSQNPGAKVCRQKN